MGFEDEDFAQSDDDFDDKKHEKLIDKILTINKTQQLKKASRSEPALQISEFDLAKSITGKKGVINVGDLASTLKKKKAHAVIKKKVETTSKIASTLPKPLEKPIADRINRTVGYEKARLELDRWEPIVTANRVSTDLLFPLPTREKDKNLDITKKWTVKTTFDIELEKTNPELIEEIHVDTQPEKVKLTLAQLRERRGELAKIRAKLSYQEAKARRQNKIKSKKYHRIQKKSRIRQQLKEFEELKKTKPDEALKKLEEIERIRAQERFSLRHKSTGKWAKHKQIHAKYDKESRAELSEQLKLSKELTEKLKESSESEDEILPQVDDSSTEISFLWTDKNLKPDSEVTNFVNKCSKFYLNKAASEENLNLKSDDELNVSQPENYHENVTLENNQGQSTLGEIISKENLKKTTPRKNTKEESMEANINEQWLQNSGKKTNKRKTASLNASSTSEWDVELVDDNIDVIFEELEKKMEIKMNKEAEKIKKQLAPQKTSKKSKKGIENSEVKDSLLALPIEEKRPRIDEPLLETIQNQEPEGELNNLNNILNKKSLNMEKTITAPIEKKKTNNNIWKKVNKVTELENKLPDLITDMNDDNDDEKHPFEEELKEIMVDCFEEDLAAQFAKDKAETIEKDKPKDIDLFLPGWGSWGGVGIAPSKRKKRRFIVKAPKKDPRKDDNKGFLIINEEANKKAKEHLVDQLPFPFQRVKDFEASIRAPIGRTFVPETAFHRLIKPAVKTKIGAIIEPMDKDVLLNKPNS